ncbi:MAG: DUF29 family protein [Methylobacter sp.]|nr:DUF29 family protein [Methylobacter sp.]
MRVKLDEFIADAYEDAILQDAKETGMEEMAFPVQYSYAQEDLLNPKFYPDLPH